MKEFKEKMDNGCAEIKVINYGDEKYLITSNIKGNLNLYSY